MSEVKTRWTRPKKVVGQPTFDDDVRAAVRFVLKGRRH
jgi:hypothetical protein